MSAPKFTESDRRFLASVGIAAELTFDEARLELAKRIAKHQPPAQVRIDPEAARQELVRRALRLFLDHDESTK